MTAERRPGLRASWSPLDFGLHAFLVVNPLVLGLWVFSFAPLVGGNLFLAVVLTGVVMLLGAVVLGSLAGRSPWAGGDYAWQARFLHPGVAAVVALASWWLAVSVFVPVYGNVVLVEVVDPLLTETGWNSLAVWFRESDGIFAGSLIAISIATAFAALGMRRAALAQRILVVVGSVSFLAVLGLLLTSSPADFAQSFDRESADLYGTGQIASSQILEIGKVDPDVTELDPAGTARLVPLLLLFALWIGWGGALAGEVRTRAPHVLRLALIRVAAVSTVLSLLFLVAIGRGETWELWNEASNLYWRTIYGTAATTPLPTWPNPIVFATWLTDSTPLRVLLIVGMAAWVVGFTATLFLAATRVLVAAASEGVLPPSVARTSGDSVPTIALGLLVVPACAFSALDAYWDSFASWSSAAVVALAATTVGSGLAAARAFGRDDRTLAVAAGFYVALVAAVAVIWAADPVYGLRTAGSFAFLVVVYGVAATLYLARGRTSAASAQA